MTGDIVKKEDMVYGRLSDLEMASKVRMLFRDTLEHESVCVGARDRIMYLSQQLQKVKAIIANDVLSALDDCVDLGMDAPNTRDTIRIIIEKTILVESV